MSQIEAAISVESKQGRRSFTKDRFKPSVLKQSSRAIVGESVNKYVPVVQDRLRDLDFDVIAGPHYRSLTSGECQPVIRLMVRPGVLTKEVRAEIVRLVNTDVDKNNRMKVPKTVALVYQEWDLLTPQAASHKRVTHNSHRLLYGEDPKSRIR